MRLRVTLLAAGAFAVVLVVASFVLVRALERALVDDVRSASEAVLRRQAALVLARGRPGRRQRVAATSGEAFELPVPGPAGAESSVAWSCSSRDAGDLPAVAELPTPRSPAAGTDVDVRRRTMPIANPACSASTARRRLPVTSLRVGGLVLATAASLEEVRDTIATTQTMFWIVGPVLVALVAGLAWLLAGRALRRSTR